MSVLSDNPQLENLNCSIVFKTAGKSKKKLSGQRQLVAIILGFQDCFFFLQVYTAYCCITAAKTSLANFGIEF